MKKLFSVICSAVVALTSLTFSAIAEEETEHHSHQDDICRLIGKSPESR